MLGVAGYFAVFGGEYSWWDLRRLERERRAQEAAVRAARQEVKALRARADSLERDSLTLERLAREQYGMIRSGERLYRFAPLTAPATRDSARNGTAPPRDTTRRSAAPGAPQTSH